MSFGGDGSGSKEGSQAKITSVAKKQNSIEEFKKPDEKAKADKSA